MALKETLPLLHFRAPVVAPPAKMLAWTRYVTCDRLTNASLDVMRQFRKAYTDKAPEFIP